MHKKVPTPEELGSRVMWVWFDDDLVNVGIYKWSDGVWKGSVSSIAPKMPVGPLWRCCGGDPMTYLPVDHDAMSRYIEINIFDFPRWFHVRYVNLIGHSER